MTLELVKIEEGLMAGDILYHSLFKKTKAEVRQLKMNRREKIKLKYSRRRQQEANVTRKRAAANREEKQSRGDYHKRPRPNTFSSKKH